MMPFSRKPLLPVALATLFVGGQLASFAHMVAVAHVACAEHGDLIDVRAAHHAEPDDSADSQPAVAAAPRGTDHGHDHCLVAPGRRERAAGPEPAPAEALAAPIRASEIVARSTPAAAPIPLLHLAPKSSPPVQAS